MRNRREQGNSDFDGSSCLREEHKSLWTPDALIWMKGRGENRGRSAIYAGWGFYHTRGRSASRGLFYFSISMKKCVKTKCFLKTTAPKRRVTISMYVTAFVCQYGTSNLFWQNKRLTFSNILCNSVKAAPVWHLKCVFLLVSFNVSSPPPLLECKFNQIKGKLYARISA